MRAFRATLLATLGVLGAVATASAQAPPVPGNPAVAVMSPNVEYLGALHQDVGLTTGARVIDDRLYVTSGKNISIYDIRNPAVPKQLGTLRTNVSWENEEVPTNGKILGFASNFYSSDPDCVSKLAVTGCMQFFDVRDPANIKNVGIIPSSSHTMECALDCRYFYGSSGAIVDARGALEGTAPKTVGNWKTAMRNQGVGQSSCHHIRELRPGILLTACLPFAVISINAEDGGSPTNPKVLYTGKAAKFVHSARWPNGGTDDLLMTGGEENFTSRCELDNSEFSTYSAKAVNAGGSKQFQGPLAQKAPAGNGVYADGKPVAGVLGCSVHWFEEHPSFEDGGLVALSEYEGGVRFLQIKPDGSITEQGYFLSLGSASSSPKWAGKDNVLYSVDYYRGVDIMRWKGETYVPTASGKVAKQKGKAKGTNGETPLQRPTRAQAARRSSIAKQLRASGWSAGVCRLASERGA